MNKKFVAKNWWIGLIAGLLGCTILSGAIVGAMQGTQYLSNAILFVIVMVCGVLMGKEGGMLMLEDKVRKVLKVLGGETK